MSDFTCFPKCPEGSWERLILQWDVRPEDREWVRKVNEWIEKEKLKDGRKEIIVGSTKEP